MLANHAKEMLTLKLWKKEMEVIFKCTTFFGWHLFDLSYLVVYLHISMSFISFLNNCFYSR